VQLARGDTEAAIGSFEQALTIYRAALQRNAEDVQARLNSVVPLWRLGELRGAAGRAELEEAFAILREFAAADRLDHRQRQWIPRIEAALAGLGE
jgi:tetratricopeptide (TPR) repeat protein